MKKIIIFTNADWHFYAHLLPIALAAKEMGYKVKILTHVEKFKEKIEGHGLEVIPITIKRSSLNPMVELMLLIDLIWILKKEKPDVLHTFTIKPILYGSLAGFVCRVPQVINTFLGMGLIFIGETLAYSIIRGLFAWIMWTIEHFKKMIFIVQNQDDAKLISSLGFARENQIVTQCSVGIPTQDFAKLADPPGPIVFALLARMLIDKGVYEFIEAAKTLKGEGLDAEFWLVGEPDPGNRMSLTEPELQKVHAECHVKYLGYQNNIEKIWKQAHVAVLPSYREGLSRSLLEAGAYGRAIITTDAPGGRELIQHNENGLLVKVRDAKCLADAMRVMASDSSLRMRFAAQIRQDILEKYDTQFIVQKMVGFYSGI